MKKFLYGYSSTVRTAFVHYDPIIHCMCFRICMLKLRRVRNYPTNKREAPAEPSHSLNNVYVSLQPRLKSLLSTFDLTTPLTRRDIMADALSQHEGLPGGVFSLLDTDLYKLTMQCAILKYLPDVREWQF